MMTNPQIPSQAKAPSHEKPSSHERLPGEEQVQPRVKAPSHEKPPSHEKLPDPAAATPPTPPAEAPVRVKKAASAQTPPRKKAASGKPVSGAQGVPGKGRKKKKKSRVGKYIRRTLLSLLTVILYAVGVVLAACATVLNGPSDTMRDLLVLSATQASATKWVPRLFLDDAVVDGIIAASQQVVTDVVSLDDYKQETNQNVDSSGETVDPWADAIDGMRLITLTERSYKGYLLLVKDPSRLYVGTSSDYRSGKSGARIFEMAEREPAVAIINGGEFEDVGGQGNGAHPMGLTYSKGTAVWTDKLKRTFIGFDKNDRMVVSEGMTQADAEALGVRDAVSFQNGNVLIEQKDGNVLLHYADNNTGTAQRTAIGQAADGTVILLVTDGRTASSLGATHNDVIDVMVQYGAVTAAMLDGGSSSMMYYRDYAEKYHVDTTTMDEYQKQGLVNKYKAFTKPRQIPTFFCVAEEAK